MVYKNLKQYIKPLLLDVRHTLYMRCVSSNRRRYHCVFLSYYAAQLSLIYLRLLSYASVFPNILSMTVCDCGMCVIVLRFCVGCQKSRARQ